MSDARQIGEFNDYDGLHRALQARASELKVRYDKLDQISGLPDGYVSKLLAPVPIRRIGMDSLGPLLQALCARCILVEDKEALRRYAHRMTERRRGMPSVGEHDIATIRITRRKLGMLARRGGKNSMAKLTPKQRSKKAAKAAKARWKLARERRKAKAARARERIGGLCSSQTLTPSESIRDSLYISKV